MQQILFRHRAARLFCTMNLKSKISVTSLWYLIISNTLQNYQAMFIENDTKFHHLEPDAFIRRRQICYYAREYDLLQFPHLYLRKIFKEGESEIRECTIQNQDKFILHCSYTDDLEFRRSVLQSLNQELLLVFGKHLEILGPCYIGELKHEHFTHIKDAPRKIIKNLLSSTFIFWSASALH